MTKVHANWIKDVRLSMTVPDLEVLIAATECASQKNVEVTPEMIEAGVRAYDLWMAKVAPYEQGRKFDLPQQIYRAMEQAHKNDS